MPPRPRAASVDDYIAGFPDHTRAVLQQLRSLILGSAPDLTERISYAIPTFDLDGRYLVYMAGFEKHVSVYPVTPGVEKALGERIEPFRSGRGTLRFPVAEPLPADIIREVVAARVEEARHPSK